MDAEIRQLERRLSGGDTTAYAPLERAMRRVRPMGLKELAREAFGLPKLTSILNDINYAQIEQRFAADYFRSHTLGTYSERDARWTRSLYRLAQPLIEFELAQDIAFLRRHAPELLR